MVYVEGFVLVVPKKNMAAYTKMAKAAAKIWVEHGALEYYECAADDMKTKGGALPFPKLTKAKAGETVVFSWVIYRSKASRTAVMKKVMGDKRLASMCAGGKMPFDMKRMAYGGFKPIVIG